MWYEQQTSVRRRPLSRIRGVRPDGGFDKSPRPSRHYAEPGPADRVPETN